MRATATLYAWAVVIGTGTAAEPSQLVVHVNNTTSDCRNPSVQEHRVCPSSGEKIVGTPNIRVTSRNGVSEVITQHFEAQDDRCYVVQTRATPLGEDCIRLPFGQPVCNCRGRGWIALDITVATEPAKPPQQNAQDTVVGTYSGSYEGKGNQRLGITLAITSLRDGKLKGTATLQAGPCRGSYPVEGFVKDTAIGVFAIEKGGPGGDCGFGFKGMIDGNRLVGSLGGRFELELYK